MHIAGFVQTFFQIGQLLFGFLQTILQFLLTLIEALLSLTTQLFDLGERPGKLTTAAQVDQITRARHLFNGVEHQVAVVGKRLGNALTKEILHLYPVAIGQHIGIGHDHNIDAGFDTFTAIVLGIFRCRHRRFGWAADAHGNIQR